MLSKISIDSARKIITTQNLSPVGDIWHYSFNIEHFYSYMLLSENNGSIYVYAPLVINQWCPLPIFTNEHVILPDRATSNTPFWFCRLTTFENFLDRRSVLSKNPRKHFPSRQTFQKKDNELRGRFFIGDLDEKNFREIYERLRRPAHLNGDETLNVFYRSNVNTPKQWFKMMTLTVAEKIVGIGLIVDDGRSQSLVNLASVIDKNRLGLYMLTLWIRYCCLINRQSVDAGVSGTYGIYKDQLFLDSQVVKLEVT